MINLSNLQVKSNSKHRRKRRGRGNASGHGAYCGRGQKGQRSRSGGKRGLKIKGLKRNIKSFPKFSGFKSLIPKFQIISLEGIQKKFKNTEVVGLKELIAAELIKNSRQRVKILYNPLSDKKISLPARIEAHAFSKKAKEAIEKAGSRVIIINK